MPEAAMKICKKVSVSAGKNGKIIVKNVNKVVNFANKVGNMQMKLC